MPPAADLQTKREVRLRIARLRRSVDRRVSAVQRRGRAAIDWRTYVRRHPVLAVTAAAGVGLILSSTEMGRRWARWLGCRLARRAGGWLGEDLSRELWGKERRD